MTDEKGAGKKGFFSTKSGKIMSVSVLAGVGIIYFFNRNNGNSAASQASTVAPDAALASSMGANPSGTNDTSWQDVQNALDQLGAGQQSIATAIGDLAAQQAASGNTSTSSTSTNTKTTSTATTTTAAKSTSAAPMTTVTAHKSGRSTKSSPVKSSPAKSHYSLVEMGSRGSSVATLQRDLGIPADGIFGPQTRAAVEQYQRAHGLSVDGIVGQQTWASLNAGGYKGFHYKAPATKHKTAAKKPSVTPKPGTSFNKWTPAQQYNAYHKGDRNFRS